MDGYEIWGAGFPAKSAWRSTAAADFVAIARQADKTGLVFDSAEYRPPLSHVMPALGGTTTMTFAGGRPSRR